MHGQCDPHLVPFIGTSTGDIEDTCRNGLERWKRMPGLFYGRSGRAFVRRLGPERVHKVDIKERSVARHKGDWSYHGSTFAETLP